MSSWAGYPGCFGFSRSEYPPGPMSRVWSWNWSWYRFWWSGRRAWRDTVRPF